MRQSLDGNDNALSKERVLSSIRVYRTRSTANEKRKKILCLVCCYAEHAMNRVHTDRLA